LSRIVVTSAEVAWRTAERPVRRGAVARAGARHGTHGRSPDGSATGGRVGVVWVEAPGKICHHRGILPTLTGRARPNDHPPGPRSSRAAWSSWCSRAGAWSRNRTTTTRVRSREGYREEQREDADVPGDSE